MVAAICRWCVMYINSPRPSHLLFFSIYSFFLLVHLPIPFVFFRFSWFSTCCVKQINKQKELARSISSCVHDAFFRSSTTLFYIKYIQCDLASALVYAKQKCTPLVVMPWPACHRYVLHTHTHNHLVCCYIVDDGDGGVE